LILSYRDLLAAWKKKRLRFDPDISESQIGLSSIDLRLGHVFTKLKDVPGIVVQPARGFDPTDLVEIEDTSRGAGFASGGPIFRLPPGEFRLAFTLEAVTLPPDLAAGVQGKSSLARAGLAVHITAPHIHPAFPGHVTLELYNHGPWTLEFVPGEDRICQLILYRVTTPVAKPVADALSTYARQATPFPKRRVRDGGTGKGRRR
jgi:dCTP deaminase